MRINKLTAIVLAGAISCTAPAMVYADDTSAADTSSEDTSTADIQS